jgi:serine/threonine protein kinase
MIIDSRYKVLKELGAGIWATVYKVKDLRTNKTFALKLFQTVYMRNSLLRTCIILPDYIIPI